MMSGIFRPAVPEPCRMKKTFFLLNRLPAILGAVLVRAISEASSKYRRLVV